MMARNYKPRGTVSFLHLTWKTWLKSANLRVTPGQLDLSFMHWFTSKSLRQDSLRRAVCDQSSPLFVNSILSLLFILRFRVTIQISCIIVSAQRHFNFPRTISDAQNKELWCKIMINVLLCWLTIEETTLLFLCSADFASGRAAIIIHFQAGNNQGLQKKIR